MKALRVVLVSLIGMSLVACLVVWLLHRVDRHALAPTGRAAAQQPADRERPRPVEILAFSNSGDVETARAGGSESVREESIAGERSAVPRRHALLALRGELSAETLLRLERAGARPVAFLPPDRLAVTLPGNADAADVADVALEVELEPLDKLSPRTVVAVEGAAAGEPLLVFAEFYRDVTAEEALGAAAAAGVDVFPRDGLPDYVLLAGGPAESISRLAMTDTVLFIVAAPQRFIENEGRIHFSSDQADPLPVERGYSAPYDGWDGPGQGSASLRYYFGQMTSDVAAEDAEAELARALQTWSLYADITWTQTPAAHRTRSVDFGWQVQGESGYDFDGPGGVLAHAYYPSPPNPEPIAGDVEFDDAEIWEIGDPGPGFDIFSVGLHELGHSLGLGHSDDPTAVMYYAIGEWEVFTDLAADDIAGIQSIYAVPPVTSAEVLSWQSVNSHGAAGEVAIELADGGSEPRAGGLHTLRLVFDMPINPGSLNSVPLTVSGQTSGPLSLTGWTAHLDGSGTVLTVTLTLPLANGDRYTLAVAPAVETTEGLPVEVNSQITVGALVGDVDGSGQVSAADVLVARALAGSSVGPASARGDVNNSGAITASDMIGVRRRLGEALP